MATILSCTATVASDCKSIAFNETTGAYSLSNLTGWGSPNETTGDAVDVMLTVTDPDGNDTVLTDLTNFPTTDSDVTYTINAASLGLTAGSQLPDGAYTLEYSVETGTTTYTQTVRAYVYCAVKCCVFNYFTDIGFTDCDCEDEAIETALMYYAMYKAMENAATLDDEAEFTRLLTKLEGICGSTNDCNC